jgi:hypothetical protein
MNHIGITVAAVGFWLFLTVVSVAGIILEHRKRKLALEPIRMAIEHGQQLSPEVIDRLLGREEREHEIDPRHLEIGGIITCASGVGVALLSAFVAMVHPPHHWIVLGIGVVAICVGVGLMLAAKSLRR